MPRPPRSKVTHHPKQSARISRAVAAREADHPEEATVTKDESQVRPRGGRYTREASRPAATTSLSSITAHRQGAQSMGREGPDRVAARAEVESTAPAISGDDSSGTIYGMSSSPEVEMGRRAVGSDAPVQANSDMTESLQPSGVRVRSRQQLKNGPAEAMAAGEGVEELHVAGSSNEAEDPQAVSARPPDLRFQDMRTTSKAASPVQPHQPLAQPMSAFKFGTLKRRTRQPSIFGTMRRPLGESRRGGTDESAQEKDGEDGRKSEGGDDDEVGGEEDFDPEDASTPLHLSAKYITNTGLSQPEIPSRQGRKRKRSPSSAQPPLSGPARAPTSSPNVLISGSPEIADVGSEDGSVVVEPLSETMAPPRSSSSPIPRRNPVVSQQHHLPRSTRHATRHATTLSGNDSDIASSPPSLIHSPDYAANSRDHTRRGRVPLARDTAVLATAQLQAMLPTRRRRRGRNGLDPDMDDAQYPIDTSGLASDEDELSNLGGLKRRSGKREATVPAGLSLKPRSARVDAAQHSSELISSKRTYGTSRGRISGKENNAGAEDCIGESAMDEDPSSPDHGENSPENSQDLEARIGRELKTAKRKFEVVDKWELDYEDESGNSSGLWNAKI